MNAREAMHLVELRSGREGHPGYRAVSAIPGLEAGRPIVEVTLVRGGDWKVVIERLD